MRRFVRKSLLLFEPPLDGCSQVAFGCLIVPNRGIDARPADVATKFVGLYLDGLTVVEDSRLKVALLGMDACPLEVIQIPAWIQFDDFVVIDNCPLPVPSPLFERCADLVVLPRRGELNRLVVVAQSQIQISQCTIVECPNRIVLGVHGFALDSFAECGNFRFVLDSSPRLIE